MREGRDSKRLPFTIKLLPVFNVVFKYECKLAELKRTALWGPELYREEQIPKASLARGVGRSERLRVGS